MNETRTGPEASAGEESWRWPEPRWRAIVERVRAGRSLKPDGWPGGARVAVALSFDSDHESSTLRWGQESPGKLSQGEYGARVAVPRIRRLLHAHDIRASFFVPAVVAKIHPDEQRALVAEGHEIGIHGWIHERNSQLSPAVERELQMRSADALEAITGVRPVGIRTPSWDFSLHTLAISREMGLLYDSSLMADDDPYELLENGEPTGMVELPVEWIRDDAVYFNMDRFSALRPYTPPSGVLEIFRAEFDGAYRESGLFLLTMHPHFIGHRSRMGVLERLIEHIRGHEGVWFATHAQIARYCLEQAGASRDESPAEPPER
jgi:peptidoglycan-N-acetylglucosamine deacetylase